MSFRHKEEKEADRRSAYSSPFYVREKKEEMMSKKIIVYVNDKRVTLYRGMRVRHALTLQQVRLIESNKAEVRDSHGHVIGLDGALSGGEKITFCQKDE